MAGTQPGQNSTAAAAITSGTAATGTGDLARPPTQVLMDLMDKIMTLLTAVVEPGIRLSMMRRWHDYVRR